MKMMMKSTHEEMLFDQDQPLQPRKNGIKYLPNPSEIPELRTTGSSTNPNPPLSRNVIGNKSQSLIDPKSDPPQPLCHLCHPEESKEPKSLPKSDMLITELQSQKPTCQYHRTKKLSQDDDSIEFDNESSKSEDEEEEFQFNDSMEREEYNVWQNRKLFKDVKRKMKVNRKSSKVVTEHVLKKNANLSLKEQEEVLEHLLVKQKN